MSKIKSVMPMSLIPMEITSDSEYVVRRRSSEIPANESTTFGSTPGNYRCQFNIGSSGIEYLDGMNSYIRCSLTVATAAEANNTVRAFLDEGGIHSLIKTLTVQLRNGTRIEHIENYNKVYAMLSNLRHNAQHIESIESHQSGDSMSYRQYLDNYKAQNDNAAILPADVGNLSVAAASALVPVTALELPNADALTGAIARGALQTNLRAELDRIARGSSIGLIEPARQKMANTAEHIIVFKPMSDFLNSNKYIPLPFLQQLQIVIEWERPNIGLFLDKFVTATGAALSNIVDADTLNYTISRPTFVANLVEPSPAVTNMMEKLYAGPGIHMQFLSYKSNRKIETGASINQEISTTYRSARYVLAAVMEDEAFTEGNAAKAYHSNSTFRKSGMTSWIFKSGGMRFPEHGPIDTRTIYSAETFASSMIAVNSHGSILHDSRIRPWEWYSDYTKTLSGVGGNKTIADSTKFIIGASLSRSGAFTGADLTNNSLFLEAEFDNGAGANTYVGNKNLFTVIGFDAVLSISAQSGSVLRY